MDNPSYQEDTGRTNSNTNGDTKPVKDSGVTFEDIGSRAPVLCSSRLSLAIISCLGFINLYALRVNMSVAMVCMVNQTAIRQLRGTNSNVTSSRPSACQQVNTTSSSALEDGEFSWSKEVQGQILGSFFWGYLTTQVVGGWLSQRFGGKRVFGWSMLVCSLVTLLMPVAARLHYIALMVTRVVAGVCQGVVWPAMAVLWARWAPPLERGMLCSICYAGSQVGNVVTFPVSALLCEYGGGWPSVFYVLGSAGVVWFIFWTFMVYDSPELHPRTSQAERSYISTSLNGSVSADVKDNRPTPWLEIAKSMKVWAIVVSHTCSNWGTYTFLTNIPTYLKEVLYFPIQSNGALSALPYVGFFVVINISGVVFDVIMKKQIVSRTLGRKIGNTLGVLLPGLFVLGVGFLDCTNSVWAVSLLIMGVSMSGFQYGAGFLTNPSDIAPPYAGIIFGISNTFATLPGFIAPAVIGYITQDQTQAQWQTVFIISCAIYAFGALFFAIFSSGDVQPWASPNLNLEKTVEKDSQLSPTAEKDSRL